MNGVRLTAPDLAELDAVFGASPEPGRYWYDAVSGLFGLEGHGPGGCTRPELRTVAPLPADVSAGQTGVYVNGRQVTASELAAMAKLLGWAPPTATTGAGYVGRHTLDADGGVYSAQGRYLGNVATAAKRGVVAEASAGWACVWFHLHEADTPLGRAVTVACD